MSVLYKLLRIDVSDVIAILLAIPILMLLTGGVINLGGLIGIVVGNRLIALFDK